MKIKKVTVNNRRKAFEVATHGKAYVFPYVKLESGPSRDNRITNVYVDGELDNEAFTTQNVKLFLSEPLASPAT